MGIIAAYQEGFTDGYQDGKDAARKLLRHFIAEQHIEDPDRPHDRGYNSALKDLSEFIEEIL